jgi:hypothetical protein
MNKKIFGSMTLAMASLALAAVNTSLWFDGTNQQVNTGGDCVYEYGVCESSTMGYWYDYDDRKNDKGSSYALYPYEADTYGSLIAPMIEAVGYVYWKYQLNVNTGTTAEYPYNFVGFGFNTVNGAKDALDMTAAGGLCATYTSDMAITLEVSEAVSGDASCSITLAKSATSNEIKTVSKTIADFKQPSWVTAANKLTSCSAAFAAAQSVKFKLDGGNSAATGTVRVFEVGPAGTCLGGKAIGAETVPAYKSDGDGGLEGTGFNDKVAASSVRAILSGNTLFFVGNVSGASVEVINLQGQVMMKSVLSSSSSLKLSSLNTGVYMVRVAGKSVNLNQKIMLK